MKYVLITIAGITLSGCMDFMAHGLDAGTDAARAQDELQAQAHMHTSCKQLRLQLAAIAPSVTGPRIIFAGGAGPMMRAQYDGIAEAMRRKGCSGAPKA